MENIANVKNTENKKTSLDKFLAGLPIFWELHVKKALTGTLHAMVVLFSAAVIAYTAAGALSFLVHLKCQPEWNIVLARVTFGVVLTSLFGFVTAKLVRYITRLGSHACSH